MSRYRPRGLYPPSASESYRRERHAAHFSERPKTMFDPDKTYEAESIQAHYQTAHTSKTKTGTHVLLHLEGNGQTREDGSSPHFDVTVSYSPEYLRYSRDPSQIIESNNIPRIQIKTQRGESHASAQSYTPEEAIAIRDALNTFLTMTNLG